ncbi:MAG: phage head-tail connector protein [Alphaproteobacteria bacterium]|nr:phage head-tail connector protein [Alphaproteobacteria bacterium]
MAERATDIVSVIQAKQQLDIPLDVVDQDSLLSDLIAQCVSWIEHRTGLPLIQSKERYVLERSEAGEPLGFAVYNIVSIDAFTQCGRDGAPVTVTEGLPVYGTDGPQPRLWPPGGAWPASHPRAPFVVDVTRELEPTPPVVQRLALELLTRLYDGEPIGRGGGTRVMLEVLAREPARRLKAAAVLMRGGEALPSGVVTLRGEALTARDGSFVTLRP